MTLTVSGLGHAVLKVRDLERSLDFYAGALGLREVARRDFGEGLMVFLSTGNAHHDLALLQIGDAAPDQSPDAVGLHHLALRIGNDLDALRKAKEHLHDHGIPIRWTLNHVVSQGIYITDPDSHLLELYVDASPDLWRTNPKLVANSEPLAI